MEIENKKARFDFEIKDTYEAGMVLRGLTVKALKDGQGSIAGCYATVNNGNVDAHIMVNGNAMPVRLLLTKKEIGDIQSSIGEKGNTIVLIKLFTRAGMFKALIGVGRGKKKWDKRETIKKRDDERRGE